MTREETIYELGEWLEQMIQHGVPSHSTKRKALATAIALLSAEDVEVVRCKDCKHYEFADNRAFGMPAKYCDWFGFEDVDDDDFCSRGERKGGGNHGTA